MKTDTEEKSAGNGYSKGEEENGEYSTDEGGSYHE